MSPLQTWVFTVWLFRVPGGQDFFGSVRKRGLRMHPAVLQCLEEERMEKERSQKNTHCGGRKSEAETLRGEFQKVGFINNAGCCREGKRWATTNFERRNCL